MSKALRLARKPTDGGERGPEALALAVWSAVSAALGQLDSARAHAHEALTLAEAEGDEQARIEAALAVAEVELMAENLQSAVNAFNRAATLAQAREAVVADTIRVCRAGAHPAAARAMGGSRERLPGRAATPARR